MGEYKSRCELKRAKMMDTAKAGIETAASAAGVSIDSATSATGHIMQGAQSKFNSVTADAAAKVERQLQELVESDQDVKTTLTALPEQAREVLRNHFDLDPSAT